MCVESTWSWFWSLKCTQNPGMSWHVCIHMWSHVYMIIWYMSPALDNWQVHNLGTYEYTKIDMSTFHMRVCNNQPSQSTDHLGAAIHRPISKGAYYPTNPNLGIVGISPRRSGGASAEALMMLTLEEEHGYRPSLVVTVCVSEFLSLANSAHTFNIEICCRMDLEFGAVQVDSDYWEALLWCQFEKLQGQG